VPGGCSWLAPAPHPVTSCPGRWGRAGPCQAVLRDSRSSKHGDALRGTLHGTAGAPASPCPARTSADGLCLSLRQQCPSRYQEQSPGQRGHPWALLARQAPCDAHGGLVPDAPQLSSPSDSAQHPQRPGRGDSVMEKILVQTLPCTLRVFVHASGVTQEQPPSRPGAACAARPWPHHLLGESRQPILRARLQQGEP